VTGDATNGDNAHRRRLYAEGAAVLDQDEHVAGAEALFDSALTNGLLAIMSVPWPQEILRWDGKPHAAERLLQILEDRVGLEDGVAKLPARQWPAEAAEDSPQRSLDDNETVSIQVDQVRDAVVRTQIPRHGRGPGKQVTREDVEALLDLDHVVGLHVLQDHYLDEHWRSAQVADRNETARAADYLDLLDEDEITRRQEAAESVLGPWPGRARAKSSDRRLTCSDAGVERLRSGVDSGPSRPETDRQVAPTWA
jgi:hypothetical protein